jgi:hypothetical protein
MNYVSSYDIAAIYLGLGNTSNALQWLDKAYEERAGFMPYVSLDPRLKPLRRDLHFSRPAASDGHSESELKNSRCALCSCLYPHLAKVRKAGSQLQRWRNYFRWPTRSDARSTPTISRKDCRSESNRTRTKLNRKHFGQIPMRPKEILIQISKC